MLRNDGYTTENLLNCLYHHKLNGIDSSRQKNTIIPQQSNFTGELERDDNATMFFIAEKQQKTILNFSLDSLLLSE